MRHPGLSITTYSSLDAQVSFPFLLFPFPFLLFPFPFLFFAFPFRFRFFAILLVLIRCSPHFFFFSFSFSSPLFCSFLIFSTKGFFGPFLLEQILVQCPEAQVYCLIRAATPEQGKERILKGMAEAQVLVDENAQKRIIPVSE